MSKTAILGADFLRHFGLLVDMHYHHLCDGLTQSTIQGVTCNARSPSPAILPLKPTAVYHNILAAVTQPCTSDTPTKDIVTHHITTTGRPTSARARPLGPECLRVARQEFDHTAGHHTALLYQLVLATSHGP